MVDMNLQFKNKLECIVNDKKKKNLKNVFLPVLFLTIVYVDYGILLLVGVKLKKLEEEKEEVVVVVEERQP